MSYMYAAIRSDIDNTIGNGSDCIEIIQCDFSTKEKKMLKYDFLEKRAICALKNELKSN